MAEKTREERIDEYHEKPALDLAELLVDAEDEIEVWKARLAGLEARADG